VGTTRRIIAGLVLAVLATLPALSETIRLEQFGGVYMLPVRINDTLTIPFVLDSGAAEVVITEDIFSVLRRARTVSQSDFVGTGIYTLASGATVSSDRYVIHKMSVGERHHRRDSERCFGERRPASRADLPPETAGMDA
jgi:hypothetical protein